MLTCSEFWNKNPALFLGSLAAFGAQAALDPTPALLIPLIAFILLIPKEKYLQALLVFLAATLYSTQICKLPTLTDGQKGIAYLIPTSSKKTGRQTLIRGVLHKFSTDDATTLVKGSEALVRIKGEPPPLDRHWTFPATISGGKRGMYLLKGAKVSKWTEVEGSYTLTELRGALKKKVKHYLKQRMPESRSSDFLAGLLTGDFEDKLVQKELGRFGLQHIMAISGFHFSLVAAMIASLVKRWTRPKIVGGILVFTLSCYFIFLGLTPSVLRAFIMILIGSLGCFSRGGASGTNSLGAAVLIAVMINPLIVLQIGFQFSALTTLAILMGSKFFKELISPCFPQLKPEEARALPFWDRHLLIVLLLFRDGVALGGAVNACALPLSLYYFGAFPLFSLLYNLVFPFLVALAMFLFLVASLCSLVIPWIGNVLHAINSKHLDVTLNLATNMPLDKDVWIRTEWIEGWVAALWLTFFFALLIKERNKKNTMINLS